MTTLQELRQKKSSGLVENPETLKTLSQDDLNKIIPKKEEDTSEKLLKSKIDEVSESLNGRIEQFKSEQQEIQEKTEAQVEDEIFDLPVDDIDNGLIKPDEAQKMISEVYNNAAKEIQEDPNIKAGIDAVTNVATKTTVHPENMELEDLLNDLEDDEDFNEDDEEIIKESDEDDEETQKEMIRSMQEQIEEKIKPFNNVYDLKSFKISTKPKSATNVLKNVTAGPTATWVLLESGVPFTCTALGAVEIENLDPNKTNVQNGRIDALKQMYGTLYRHYASPNKPNTLEEWLKTIAFSDQDNLIFGYYKATFGQSNLMNYACEKCNDVKIKDIPINDCIKYKDDKTKEEVENILKYGDPTYRGEIKADIFQVSDNLAVSIKNPSIYNIVFEFGVLDAEFTSKYADVLGTIGYIEDIYEIDPTGTLIPIKVKEDPKNLTASVKRRIRAKLEVLKTLTPDQYNILLSKITKFANDSNRITYCQPAYTCQKCGEEIAEAEMTAQGMLFIRHQLALIKSLSTE